ncbi:MAG TPA: phosphotransferase [Nocardioidaceae bacterium]|nr:phosphotransferase [Nocardioidaceae bacterium]
MTLPHDLSTVENVPHGSTARRLEWTMLPPMTRRLIETRLGSPVVHAASAGAGFTPGFASVLTTTDGRRHFVKAASKKAQEPFANSYREEVRKLRLLPEGLPVPRLLWSHEDEAWIVLGLEYVEGATPRRPWTEADLSACLDTLEVLADRLTPAPERMALGTFAEDFASFRTGWQHVREHAPGWPHLEEVTALADRMEEATKGDALVHTDGRDDNFLLRADGTALLCDWNWPVLGAAWIDTVLLLISAYGDGLDTEAVLARRRLTRDVDPEHVDVLLALICGYMLECRDRPVPTSSPFLRVHARWYSEATWSWLARRRGWS